MAELPHFSLPFRLQGASFAVSEQDTIDEIADCVELILRTEQGQRATLPAFGRPEMLAFTTDRELARVQVQQAIDDSEPRVRATVQRGDLDPRDPGVLRLLAMYELEGAE